jgi:branched-chain amino acid transport system permease protein
MTRSARRSTLLAVLILIAAAVPLLGEVYYTRLATEIAILGMAALSVDLLLGYGGLLTFGQAAFFGIGAYVAGILTVAGATSALVVWPASMLAAAAAALAIGALALRTAGFPFIMVTLAFAQMTYYFFQSLRQLGGENGFSLPQRNDFLGLPLQNHTVFYYVVLALLIGVVYVATRIVNSQFGSVVRGARDNERRLAAIGFPPYRYKLVAFAISGAIAGLAGALIANHTGQVSTGLLTWQQSGDFLAMVILGSAGTLIGPVFGAAIFLLFQHLLSDVTEHWMLFFGPLLVARVLFVREGLWGMLVRLFGAQEAARRPPADLIAEPVPAAPRPGGGE